MVLNGTGITTIRVEGVTKVFGAVRALDRVTLEVGSGDVVAVMGPNGAGKSTLLSMLSLTMRPTRGAVLFNGQRASLVCGSMTAEIWLRSVRL